MSFCDIKPGSAAVTDQTQDTRHEGAEPPRPPIPDLGFFAGAPTPRDPSPGFGGSSPGGAPSPFGTPATSTFGTPAASPFGTPAASTFGTPAPFDTSAPWAETGQHPSGRSGWSGRARALVAAAAVIVLVAVVFGGRFGWQQFFADPVTPDTLLGMPKVTGAGTDEMANQMRDQLGDELSSGSKAEVALYTNGQGMGILLFAIRGSDGPGASSSNGKDPFAGWAKSQVGDTVCYSKPAQTPAGIGTTLCTRTFWRRAVIVVGLSTPSLAPQSVAQATDEAWDAQ
ncbi:MAG: hypothetical protein QOD68_3039 [Actinomycetota bacterium]|nr:hypothetical protein [Actinomycetota bacterium]